MHLSTLVGYIFVILGCSGLGLWYSRQMKQKVFHLKEMIRILELFCSEIDYGKNTLIECFEIVKEKTLNPYKDMLEKMSETGFGKDLEICLQEGLKGLPMKEEGEYFIRCFLDVGYEDGRMQKRAMERGIEQLQMCVESEEEDLKKRSKLAITLGTMCGVLLVLIML